MVSTPITERREVTERQQITQASPPAAPPPTKERLFTDWSSEDSPRERANQQLQSVRSTESRGIPSQMEQTKRESRDAREVRHVPESVMTSSSTQEQTNQEGTRISDREPNTAVVEIRLTRDEEIIHSHNQGVQVPLPNGGISSCSTLTEESIERTIMPNIMPQLDGPAYVCTQRRHPLPITIRTTIPGDGFPDDSNSDSRGYRSRENRGYPGRRRYH